MYDTPSHPDWWPDDDRFGDPIRFVRYDGFMTLRREWDSEEDELEN